MTGLTKFLLVAAAVGVTWWGNKLYRLSRDLVFSYSGMEWNQSFSDPVIKINLSITNAGNHSAKISNLRGNICYKTGSVLEPVFFVSIDRSYQLVPLGSVTELVVLKPVQQSIEDGVFRTALSDFTGNIYFKGWINVDNIPLPLKINLL